LKCRRTKPPKTKRRSAKSDRWWGPELPCRSLTGLTSWSGNEKMCLEFGFSSLLIRVGVRNFKFCYYGLITYYISLNRRKCNEICGTYLIFLFVWLKSNKKLLESLSQWVQRVEAVEWSRSSPTFLKLDCHRPNLASSSQVQQQRPSLEQPYRKKGNPKLKLREILRK
jgi:hypothetical protein